MGQTLLLFRSAALTWMMPERLATNSESPASRPARQPIMGLVSLPFLRMTNCKS